MRRLATLQCFAPLALGLAFGLSFVAAPVSAGAQAAPQTASSDSFDGRVTVYSYMPSIGSGNARLDRMLVMIEQGLKEVLSTNTELRFVPNRDAKPIRDLGAPRTHADSTAIGVSVDFTYDYHSSVPSKMIWSVFGPGVCPKLLQRGSVRIDDAGSDDAQVALLARILAEKVKTAASPDCRR